MLDTSCYNKNPTKPKFLRVVKTLNLKDYNLIKTAENFFIWQRLTKNKKPSHEYIRLCLIRDNDKFYSDYFYWNLELSFIFGNYKHNHKEDSNIKSERFKFNEDDKFYNYFLNMIDRINLKGRY